MNESNEQAVNEETDGNVSQTPVVGEQVAVADVAQVPTAEEQAQQKLTMEQQRKFFTLLKHGALFLQFIRKDIDKQKDKYMNRNQRRRFEKELSNAIFSKELIDVYSAKVDQIIGFIDEAMNPKPKEETPAVDAVQFLADAKAKEEAGLLNADGSDKEVVEEQGNA